MKKVFLFGILFLLLSVNASAASLRYMESIPSVVMIESSSEFGEEVYGTGFFMSRDAYILTVSHIIIDERTNRPYKDIQICTIANEFSTPFCEFSAKVIAYNTDYDLAVLAPEHYIDEDGNPTADDIDLDALNLPYIDLADYLPPIGEKLTILGFPNASQLASITLTEGIVSGFSTNEDGYVNEIATDATINPGNSGGPAYNSEERVVGVVIAISTDGIGGNYGYVISNDLIYAWFWELANTGLLNPDFVEEVFSNDPVYEEGTTEFPVDEDEAIFSDVSASHKYAQAIFYLKEWGILNGYPDGSFKPQGEINRAELLKVLILAGGYNPSSAYKECFPDIKEEWFAPYVCFAKIKGWVNGYADGNFKPSQSVTKAEALKMIFNVFEVEVAGTDEDVFKDVRVGSWFTDYVYSANLLNFLDDDSPFFHPNSNILRGQVSEYIFRAVK